MIGIIDIGIGNLSSLGSALNKLNIEFKFCKNKDELVDCRKILLPGVGAFGSFMEKLKINNFDQFIRIKVIDEYMPILGICVGMEVLFSKSFEKGEFHGLNFINGCFKILDSKEINMSIPHVGWNTCDIVKKNLLFDGINDKSDFYFTHSYILTEYNEDCVISYTNYYLDFPSSICSKNIFGVQFHPEKSQHNGLKLIKNFVENC
jgi:glutamine amidotransferase